MLVSEAYLKALQFPINRHHQGLATVDDFVSCAELLQFTINRRHQGLATPKMPGGSRSARMGFQSIGVTKDWRRPEALDLAAKHGFWVSNQ